MAQEAFTFGSDASARAISPFMELGAYEALWTKPGTTFKRLADQFRAHPDALPSDLVEPTEARSMAEKVIRDLKSHGVKRFGVRVHRDQDYPDRLRDAAHPVELLYFQGAWDYVEAPSVAVVGTRKPTDAGVKRTRALVKKLVRDDWTIVSGLAAGVDTVAHSTALEMSGRTIAVLGTPLLETYPRENRELQVRIADSCLVISQVPVERYAQQIWMQNRAFFPERNRTMSALTDATVIVEAGETSGTLVQARAALKQGRKLFILDSCFRKPNLTWPARFEKQGAIRVNDFEQIRDALKAASN